MALQDKQQAVSTTIIDSSIPKMSEDKLPRNLDVLQILLFKTMKENIKMDTALELTVNEVLKIDEKSSIQFIRRDHCKNKLKMLHSELKCIQKLKNKNSDRATKFHTRLMDVFDISQDDIIKMFDTFHARARQVFLSKSIEDIKCHMQQIQTRNTPPGMKNIDH